MDKLISSNNIGPWITRFALRRPVTISMLFISLLLLGVISSRLLPLEKFPGIDVPQITIHVPYPNSTPAEVERLITRPIEEAVATVSGIKSLRSQSQADASSVQITFNWDENIQAKNVEAREKVDSIRHLLPSDVERVLIFQFNTNDLPIFELRISSEKDLSESYELLERYLKRPLERVPGVSQVELYGVQKREVAIELDNNRLALHNLNAVDVARALQKHNFTMSAGQLDTGNKKLRIKPHGQFSDLSEYENIMITPYIRLKDIASITLELPEMNEGRHLDQTYAIGLNVKKESSANLVDVASRALAVVDQAGKHPQFNGINLFVMENMAEGVTTSLSDLLSAGILGSLLSVLVLYAFLRNFKTTLIVVLSVPFAICITLGAMYLLGYSLNILSMMGLMLAIGMLVDNAVVITESITQERVHEKDIRKATLLGVDKVSLAVIAGTMTTAIVFLPNIVGDKVQLTIFLEHVAIAICISLFASLLVAQTLIPLLASKIKTKAREKRTTPSAWLQRYTQSLAWCLDHQRLSGLFAILILASVAIPIALTPDDSDPDDSNDRLYIKYHLDESYPVEITEAMVNTVEDYLYANQKAFYIDSVYSYFNTDEATTTLILEKDLPIKKADLMDMVRKDWPELARAHIQFGFDDAGDDGVEIHLKGHSTDVLMQISEQLLPKLSAIEGLSDVSSEISNSSKELQIIINRQEAHRLGLSTSQLADQVALSIRGMNLRTLRHPSRGELNVNVKFDKKYTHSLQAIAQLPVAKIDGKTITLSQVASLKIEPQLQSIQRVSRQTALVIKANLAEGVTLEDAKQSIEPLLAQMRFPDGYEWSLDGGFKQFKKNKNIMLQNMLLAIAMIYIVMAALFESILLPTAVLISLILSIVGVFWTFLLLGMPMSTLAMIGILILIGIVVNNGIVLVDQINQLHNQHMPLRDAILKGGLSRAKPILMTAATTIIGLLPLALGNTSIGGDGPPYSPMAIAIIGGLTFSTVMSLYLVPLAYVWLLTWRTRSAALLRWAGETKVLTQKS